MNNLQANSNNSYYDLTLKEFLDLITYSERIYEIKVSNSTDTENDVLVGTLSQIRNVIFGTSISEENKRIFLDFIDEHKKEVYDKVLNYIEIYNYLEKITSNFNKEKIKIILNDIDLYCQMDFYERIDTESNNIYNEKGWEMPGEFRKDELMGNRFFRDFKKMREKTHPGESWNIERTIDLLTIKLSEISSDDELKTIVPTLLTKYGTDKQKLKDLHSKMGFYLKFDQDSWLYWFCNIYTSKPKQIEWQQSIPELLYLMECICPDGFPKTGNRKIKELNEIFKPINGKMIEGSHKTTTNQFKKNLISKIIN